MKTGKERRKRLLSLLKLGEVDVDELAKQFEVSASTVRRDLQQLSHANVITRTYGGAILAHPIPEETLNQRQSVNAEQKAAIARTAAELIADGDVLILDAGSTVTALGQLLKGRRNRIITNNLALVAVMATEPETDLIFLGGSFRATSTSTFGPLAFDAMQRMTADKAFLGADGVVAERGLCEASLDQSALKSIMIQQARDVIVLADSSKLSRANQGTWARLPRHWTLVTDWSASTEHCAAFTDAGARVIQAPREAK